jgi:hypothetical protein
MRAVFVFVYSWDGVPDAAVVDELDSTKPALAAQQGYTAGPNPNISGPVYRGLPNSRQSPFILTSTMLLAPCIRHTPHRLLSPYSRGSIRLYSSPSSDFNKPYYLTTPIFYPNSGMDLTTFDATSL